MNLFEKLSAIQGKLDVFTKDMSIGEGKQSYKAVGSEQVLLVFRPLLIEHKLLLEPSVESARVTVGTTSTGTARYFTEMDMVMTWIDVESGETRPVKWYGQGVDLAGEKGCGKAQTYAEKYFIMKYFHVPTPKDDPDSDSTTRSGEKKVKGTQAAKETAEYQRKAILQMLTQLCAGDAEKIKLSVVAFTKNDKAGYPGVYMIEDISTAALPIVYAGIVTAYKKKTGADFVFKTEDEQ